MAKKKSSVPTESWENPLKESQKPKQDIGAVPGLTVSHGDIERLSTLHPNELPKTLEPHVRDAVLKRRAEKGIPVSSSVSESDVADVARLKKKIARKKARRGIGSVTRDASGKIAPTRKLIGAAEDQGVKPDPRYAGAVSSSKPRKKTRTGKLLDVKGTGKIAVPSVKRGEGGRAVGLTPEEKKAAVTTQLPTAGREVMAPQAPAQPVHVPGMLKRGGERGKVKGAAAGGYPVIHKAVGAALHHLKQAHFSIGAGLSPDKHFENFDAIHANVKGMDKQLHMSLGTAKHLISVSNGQNSPELGQTQNNINRRLNELRETHEANVQRAMAGREKKNGS